MLSVVTGLAVLLQGTGLQVVEKLASKGDPSEPFGSVAGVLATYLDPQTDETVVALLGVDIRQHRNGE